MKNKKSLIITLVVILIVLILVAVGALLYFTTDLFKTDAELFYEYMAKNTELAEMVKSKDTNQLAYDKYITKAQIGFELTSSDVEIANESLPARNFTIEYNGKTDKQNRLASSETTLKYLSRELFKVKYIQTEDTYGIKSDEVINKYLALENNNLQELAAKYQIEGNFPDKISNDTLKKGFTEEEKANFKNTYLPIIQNNIPTDAFSRTREESITVYNKNILANCYTLTLSKAQLNQILIQALETLKQDEMTQNMILDRGHYETVEELQEAIQNEMDKISKDTEEIADYLVINVYEKDKNLYKTEIIINQRQFTIDFDRSETAKRVLLTNNDFNLNEEYNLESVELVEGTDATTKQNIIILKMKNANKQTVTVSFQNKQNQDMTSNTVVNVNINDETYLKIAMDKQIEVVEEIEIEKLDSKNSVKINDFAPEYGLQTLQAIGTRLTQLFGEKVMFLMTNEEIRQEENAIISDTPTIPNEPITTNEPEHTTQPENTIQSTNTIESINSIEGTNSNSVNSVPTNEVEQPEGFIPIDAVNNITANTI